MKESDPRIIINKLKQEVTDEVKSYLKRHSREPECIFMRQDIWDELLAAARESSSPNTIISKRTNGAYTRGFLGLPVYVSILYREPFIVGLDHSNLNNQ